MWYQMYATVDSTVSAWLGLTSAVQHTHSWQVNHLFMYMYVSLCTYLA